MHLRLTPRSMTLDDLEFSEMDGWSSVLHPRQHSIGYMGDGFYRSKDPTNSIKVNLENTPILDRVLNRFRSEWIGIFSIH